MSAFTVENVAAADATAATAWSRWSTDMELLVTDSSDLVTARREVDAELDAIEMAASRFRPDSEIVELTRSAGRPTTISPLLAELLAAALRAAHFTDGAVDPTVGAALVDLGYDRDVQDIQDMVPPAVTATVPATWRMVELAGQVVTVADGVVLDLGATAKAVAADRCAERVWRATAHGVLVNLGGDIATAGPAPEGGWQIVVRDDDNDPGCAVTLGGRFGMATSSTVRRRWRRGGGDLVHHIIDPGSGRPADPVWRTVSVVAGSCVDANTVSTAAIVKGRSAPEWITALGLPARLVDSHLVVQTLGSWPSDPGRWR